jgi:NAD(P)-dependent dehydrogenase (short-subunit alcohol dehydrogenase family)
MTDARYASLAGRAVIVSGGATGIGAAIVRAFAVQGARVGFFDLNEQAGRDLAAAIGADGSAAAPVFHVLDLTDAEAIRPAVDAMAETLGGVDVLVNNAANDERHALSDITPAYWRDRLAVNLDHQMFLAQAVVPWMEKAGAGSIVNMGSCSWRLGLAGLTAYVTAKAGVEGLTNGLARELGPMRIRVNCVVPGWVRTPRQIEKWLTPELERVVRAGQCLPDMVEPEDVAAMVLFLASDAARSCTSGAFPVDGGWI